MLSRVASETLGALHREAITNTTEIYAILRRAADEGSVLEAGINRWSEPRAARIVRVESDAILLAVGNIGPDEWPQLFFTLQLGDIQYFFACSGTSAISGGALRVTIPHSIYRSERRDLGRIRPARREIMLAYRGLWSWTSVEVADETVNGLAIWLPRSMADALPPEIEFRTDNAADVLFGRVRHATSASDRAGWVKVGLSVSSVPTGNLVRVEQRDRILGRSATVRDRIRLVREIVSAVAHRAGLPVDHRYEVNVVEYQNDRGENIRAIENSWGPTENGTAVIIPPAWGRTKESMLPVALTLVESFRRFRAPIRVVRFDGTNRRGESHIDPECRKPGDEYLRFTFSQAAGDISATVDYLRRNPERAPRKIILVTFSLAAVEARHALAIDNRISGWVSIVGMPDLQSALKTISGGIDFGSGLLRGVTFGKQELVGVVADMDFTGMDAIKNGMGFLEDARRDMSRIEVPITWIHGKYDAWMDLDRVVESMSCGRTDNRRIIEVPTGHQLRSGRKALATFQLIAEEVSEMALSERKIGVIPRVSTISAARAAELARIPPTDADVRGFWADYLLGRSRVMGLELLAATNAYRNFMEAQVEMLRLAPGQRVADLGAGTGEFALCLRRGETPADLLVVELDFIRDALLRARSRREGKHVVDLMMAECVGDLDLQRGMGIPLASGSLDAVIASLLISYVSSPDRLLREILRVLKPGGRAIISSMIRDADAAMLFHDGLLEYATREARVTLGHAVDFAFDVLVRDFLNDGSRLLDLEERGRFRFWEESELRFAVAKAGFVEVETRQEFGQPAQAVIVSGRRP